MLVVIPVVLGAPWIVFVSCENAATAPALSCRAAELGMRSTKLVSTRLKPIVCEFAMFPEMFSSAYDCAERPDTAVDNAPRIPIREPPPAVPNTPTAS